MSHSKLDPYQIQRMTFDEDSNSVKVTMLPMEMAVELSAEDGDSVLAVPKMQVLEVQAGDIINTSAAKKIASHPEAGITAIIGAAEVSLGAAPISGLSICVPSVKASIDCTIILQS